MKHQMRCFESGAWLRSLFQVHRTGQAPKETKTMKAIKLNGTVNPKDVASWYLNHAGFVDELELLGAKMTEQQNASGSAV